jgi:hypothetical protein
VGDDVVMLKVKLYSPLPNIILPLSEVVVDTVILDGVGYGVSSTCVTVNVLDTLTLSRSSFVTVNFRAGLPFAPIKSET